MHILNRTAALIKDLHIRFFIYKSIDKFCSNSELNAISDTLLKIFVCLIKLVKLRFLMLYIVKQDRMRLQFLEIKINYFLSK